MAKLETLTVEQWDAVHEHRSQLLDRCLNQPFDRDTINASTAACYEAVGEKAPIMLWAPGPVAALLWAAIARDAGEKPMEKKGQLGGQLGDQLRGQLRDQLGGQLRDQLRDQLGDQLRGQLRGQLWDQLGDQLRGQLGDQLRGQLGGQLGGQLWDQLWGQLGGQLWDQLGDQLWDQLGDQLRDQLRGQLGDQLRGQLGGQLWDQLGGQLWDQLSASIISGWWIAYNAHWDIIATIDGITPPKADLLELNQHWINMMTPAMCIPFKGLCIMVDQHVDLHRDNQNRLHSTTGPAWAWHDGTEVYAIDGIRVPGWVVTEPIVARIMSDELPNTEQRRVAMAAYGWNRAIDELQLQILDAADDPTWGTLYELPDTLVERGQATLLVCQNGSPDRDGTVRTYGLLAAGDARTVVAAQASLAQLTEAEWLLMEGRS